MIEGIDPLTTGETTYGEDIKGASTVGKMPVGRTVYEDKPGIPALVPHKTPNANRDEQDRVAKGRVEKSVTSDKPKK